MQAIMVGWLCKAGFVQEAEEIFDKTVREEIFHKIVTTVMKHGRNGNRLALQGGLRSRGWRKDGEKKKKKKPPSQTSLILLLLALPRSLCPSYFPLRPSAVASFRFAPPALAEIDIKQVILCGLLEFPHQWCHPTISNAYNESCYFQASVFRGKNEFSEILGKGATKTVYRAFDELQGMEVAWNQAKLNDVFRSPEELERLYSEVHLLSTVNHDSIIHSHASWIDVEKRTINFYH
ncbi:hypothetical protein AAC387_Pa08g2664 [Persea americana]